MMNQAEYLHSTSAASQWETIGINHHHGINIPLFSLRSQTSCGIGEFPDLLPMITWCKEIGFDVLQLLPLNDMGKDTSPYSALSANALNPIYLGLHLLPYVSHNTSLQNQLCDLRQLNETPRIAYSAVQEGKEHFLRFYFREYFNKFVSAEEYKNFKAHYPWLAGYALFKAQKIKHAWQNWEDWPPGSQNPPENLLDEMEFHTFIQYLCFTQFEAIKEHARINQVFLKGDIPILISRQSADVWLNPSLFNLDFCAGAPPDMYAENGQNWGFPLYNWEALKGQNYQWWMERLRVASHFYHIYRLDHIVGFFRIWGIPLGLPAKHGFFIPEVEDQWIPHGKQMMQMMLANSPMLPIGEDLGTIPPEVRICLNSLGICGTKVMRWERHWNTDKAYIDPNEYPPQSMTTVSTHDSETLQLWWMNQPAEAKTYAASLGWNYSHELSQQQRLAILRASHHSGSLFHINLLQEYLALIPGMTWPDPAEERINIPSTFSGFNWTYRFRPFIDEIVANSHLKDAMTEILRI